MGSFKGIVFCDDRSEALVRGLTEVADNERHTHQLYSQLLESFCVSSHSSADNRDYFQAASEEDEKHYRVIEHCIFRLIGNAKSMTIATQALKPAPVIGGPDSCHNLLKALCQAEAFGVQLYSELCSIALEYDYWVFDLCYRNMHENMMHLERLKGFLSQSSSLPEAGRSGNQALG